jgi:hypothetical protein
LHTYQSRHGFADLCSARVDSPLVGYHLDLL